MHSLYSRGLRATRMQIQGLVFLIIAMRISSSASAGAATSRHRSMVSTNGISALSLSSTLAGAGTGRLGEDSASDGGHEHGKDAAENDAERGEDSHEHVRTRSQRGRAERRFRVASPIAIHVSVSTMSDYYESVDVHSPRTPPGAVERSLSRASLDICEAGECGYVMCDPEVRAAMRVLSQCDWAEADSRLLFTTTGCARVGIGGVAGGVVTPRHHHAGSVDIRLEPRGLRRCML